MSDEMTLIVSLCSGIVGSLLTLGGSKYMGGTRDKKQKGEELISLLTNILNRLNDITELANIESFDDGSLDKNYNEFLFDKGSVETITKFYFSKTTIGRVRLFLQHCEGVYLKVEMEILSEDIELSQKSIEQEMEIILRTENLQTKLDDGNLTLEKVKKFLEKQTEIEKNKMDLERLKTKVKENMIKNIENQYRLSSAFNTDSLKLLLDQTNHASQNAIYSIQHDYKLYNRLN